MHKTTQIGINTKPIPENIGVYDYDRKKEKI